MSNINVRYIKNSVHISAKKGFAPPPNIFMASTLSWSYETITGQQTPKYEVYASPIQKHIQHCHNKIQLEVHDRKDEV